MNKTKLTIWAKAIQTYEGFITPCKKYPAGSLSFRNNNPGNIKDKYGRFIKFKTYQEGFDALVDYLGRASTGKHKAYSPEFSLLEFFKVYAPSFDNNNPKKYAEYVANKLKVATNIKLKNIII